MNFQSNWIITSNWVAHAVDSFFRVTMSAIDMMRLIRSRLPLFLSLYLPFSLSLFLSIYRSSQDAAHLSNEAQFENRVKLPALAARHSLIERMLGNMNSAYSFRQTISLSSSTHWTFESKCIPPWNLQHAFPLSIRCMWQDKKTNKIH